MQNNEPARQVNSVGAQSPAPAETSEPNEFESVKSRLEEIASAVDDEDLPLDDALDLFEEAVKLGLQASSLLEVGIVVEDEPADEAAGAPDGAISESPAGEAADNNVPDDASAAAQV